MIQILAKNGADLDAITDDGKTVLDLAVRAYRWDQSCLKVVKCLVDADANIMANPRLLLDVVRSGYTSVLKYLLDKGIPLPSNILLDTLKSQSDPHMIHFLVKNGADLGAITDDGKTVLSVAVQYEEGDCLEIIRCLLDAGASIQGDSMLVILMEAAIRSQHTPLVEYLLLSWNVPLAPSILVNALQQKSSPSMIRVLVENGADLCAIADDETTVLQLALRYEGEECLEIVKILLNGGCDPWQSRTDILCAALQGCSSTRVISLLIEHGADIYGTTAHGDPPLHLAVVHYLEFECLARVKILIEAGCDTQRCDSSGTSFICVLLDYGYTLVVDYVLSVGVLLPPNILLLALQRCGSPYAINLLVDQGADVKAVFADGTTAVDLATHLYPEPDLSEILMILADATNETRPAKRRRLNPVVEFALEFEIGLENQL